MVGTAYKTAIPATVYTTSDDDSAVYAVFPEVTFGVDSSTPYVIVSTSKLVQDTVIHPCDQHGQMLGFDLIACVMTTDHAAALRDAGYDLEEVAPHVA